MKKLKQLLPTLLIPITVACGPAPTLLEMGVLDAKAPQQTGTLSDLVSKELAKNEEDVRTLLTRPIRMKFPIRVGVIPYQFYSSLDSEKKQKLFQENKSELENSDLVKEVIQMPQALIPNQPSMDTFRQLGARFQVDVVLIMTGENRFEKARNKDIPFFESFTNQAYWKSEAQIETLTLDTFSGLFLTPVKSIAKQQSELLDPTQIDFEEKQAMIQSEAERKAWKTQKEQLIARLQNIKDNTVTTTQKVTGATGTAVSTAVKEG